MHCETVYRGASRRRFHAQDLAITKALFCMVIDNDSSFLRELYRLNILCFKLTQEEINIESTD